ncbi:MAG: hemerythrin [Chloroflexota bacterium]|nr:MAG: hemerythrin [Chloroflexota bacterium]
MTTGSTITPEMTIDEVIQKHPKAQTVFTRYGVDTCCGGFRQLKDGVKVSGANLEQVLAELNAL